MVFLRFYETDIICKHHIYAISRSACATLSIHSHDNVIYVAKPAFESSYRRKIVDEAITREMEFVFDADIVQQNLRFIEVYSMLNFSYIAEIFFGEKGIKARGPIRRVSFGSHFSIYHPRRMSVSPSRREGTSNGNENKTARACEFINISNSSKKDTCF